MVNLEYSIEPLFEGIEFIKKELERNLRFLDKNLMYEIEMVSTELLENSIKYCSKHNYNEKIKFLFFLDDSNNIKMKVTNYVGSKINLKNLKKIIKKIKKFQDTHNLYIIRMQEIMNQKHHGKSQMGLYRIAYEGEYDIDYELNNDLLTVLVSKHIM